MAEFVGFAPADGGGTRATNPGAEVTREGATWTRLVGTRRGSWRNFGILRSCVDLVGDRTQTDAVLAIPSGLFLFDSLPLDFGDQLLEPSNDKSERDSIDSG